MSARAPAERHIEAWHSPRLRLRYEFGAWTSLSPCRRDPIVQYGLTVGAA